MEQAGHKQSYQVTFIQTSQETFTLIFVNYSVVIDNRMASRAITALRRFFPSGEIVLVALDIMQQPHFAGPRHLVQLLQGRKITDFKWQTAVVG